MGIKRLQRAIEALPADDPARIDFVDVLAKGTWRKFELTGALPDLDLVVDARRQAVAAGPPDSSLSARQHNLANALRIRFERTQSPPDIEAAVDAARRGVALLGDDDPRRPQGLSLLGLVLASGSARPARWLTWTRRCRSARKQQISLSATPAGAAF
ncbi:MAG: hypothetical protein ACLP70_23540 [Streptosporangiaceae bacterium]